MIKKSILNVSLILVILSLFLTGCMQNSLDNTQDKQVNLPQNSGQRDEILEEDIEEDFEDDWESEWERLEKEEEERMRKLTENIEVSGEFTLDGGFLIFAKNNNDVSVDIEFEVEFYDKEGNFLGAQNSYICGAKPNGELIDFINRYSMDSKAYKYNIYADARDTLYKEYFDQISLSHNNTGEKIVAQIKNNSEDTIESLSTIVLFYNEGKLIGFVTDSDYDLKPGRTANFDYRPPYDENYDPMKFDEYKIVVNEAYTFVF